ncbi:archaemetzincin [Thermococcus eurythermalis]|uniref:Archaemetzincin n=1 Tax=Thermococcus eurythermalis TaxID=1505907 RepID=A0A097QUL8_9EURY|nr:archaemetzincin family Zn-dependent metalloprotease [Thermococcus eurythermalis]AIU70175.1 archaemetzincin [Thermococcus eurythermalis]
MIAVVSIGTLKRSLIEGVVGFLNDYHSRFGISVEFSGEIPTEPFSVAFNPLRGQYLGRVFLPTLSALKERLNATAVLGITELDLYEEGLNFIFGLANPSLKSAVVSVHRLRNEFYGLEPDDELLIERAIKEAMHELGHVFGLRHCPNPRCVMHFSNSLYDTDVKGPLYCPVCEEKLEANLRKLGVFP